ncbi:trypsin-like serine protease [Streptomyces sp. NPDC092296]|uniref:trypsin-like serine protease n=1 Tax=Streptomyces sp. NPDC092296 TaxID=3366012 RepID=UPI00381D6CF6
MKRAQRASGKHRIRRHKLPAALLATALVGGAALVASEAWAGSDVPVATAAKSELVPTTAKSGHPVDQALVARIRKAAQRQGLLGSAPTVSSGAEASGADGSSAAVTTRIIGGSTAPIANAPSMVQLWYLLGDGTAQFCGGTLVAPDKVLTAAHCVAGLKWQQNGIVVSSTSALWNGSNGKIAGVWRQWSHPKYSDRTLQNDIAVLTLDRALTARTARLAPAGDTASYKAGTVGTVYGWGLTSAGSDPDADLSPQLRKAALPIVADATCRSALNKLPDTAGLYAAGKMLCAGKPGTGSAETTVASCHGDSGGPLVVGGRIAGIVSWGAGDCVEQGGYDVYTKVSTYTAAAMERITDTDWTEDGKADLLVRTAKGQGYVYRGGTLRSRTSTGSGWKSYNLVIQADLDRDGIADLVMRGTNGSLYWRHYTGKAWKTTRLATGWKGVRQIVVPGDLTGDGWQDMLTVDSAGKVWVYPGKGTGKFGKRFKVGSGFKGYRQLVGHGDFTGDGIPDLVARTSSGGLYLWPGKGNGKFAARRTLSQGFKSADALAAVGDVDGDGHADLLARFSNGSLYLYPGKGNGKFASRVKLGSGSWKSFTILG